MLYIAFSISHTERTNPNMNKDMFFMVWSIYRQHWGREDQLQRLAQKGRERLQKTLRVQRSWVTTIQLAKTLTEFFTDRNIQIRDSFDNLQVFSDIMMGDAQQRYREHWSIRTSSTIPSFNPLRFAYLLSHENMPATRNVLAIVAL